MQTPEGALAQQITRDRFKDNMKPEAKKAETKLRAEGHLVATLVELGPCSTA
jgi:hypothetical protein